MHINELFLTHSNCDAALALTRTNKQIHQSNAKKKFSAPLRDMVISTEEAQRCIIQQAPVNSYNDDDDDATTTTGCYFWNSNLYTYRNQARNKRSSTAQPASSAPYHRVFSVSMIWFSLCSIAAFGTSSSRVQEQRESVWSLAEKTPQFGYENKRTKRTSALYWTQVPPPQIAAGACVILILLLLCLCRLDEVGPRGIGLKIESTNTN